MWKQPSQPWSILGSMEHQKLTCRVEICCPYTEHGLGSSWYLWHVWLQQWQPQVLWSNQRRNLHNKRLREFVLIYYWLKKKKGRMLWAQVLPKKYVTLCLSLLALGLKISIPFLWFPFAKCLMKVASTLSTSLVTCREEDEPKSRVSVRRELILLT